MIPHLKAGNLSTGTGDEYGVHFLQIYVGNGLLSVMSDGKVWRSDSIAVADHAYLLKILAGRANSVRLLYGIEVPSVFVLLWRWAPELISALAVWLLAWLLYRSQRFSPIRQQNITTRRSLLEHIEASATHYWRLQQLEPLFRPLQEDIAQKARRNSPTYIKLSQAEQYKQLGLESGLSHQQVEQAMQKHTSGTEEEFLTQIQNLQTIRNSL